MLLLLLLLLLCAAVAVAIAAKSTNDHLDDNHGLHLDLDRFALGTS